MQQQNASSGYVRVGETICAVSLAGGQVRVHLPFAVNPQALSRQLLREGFPVAHEPNTPDTQGWGQEFSPNGYYPYWVFPDPERPGCSVFAFNPQPEDVVDQGADRAETVDLGDRSRKVIQRWVRVLSRLKQEGTEVQH